MTTMLVAAQSNNDQNNDLNNTNKNDTKKNNKHRPDLWGVWISIKEFYGVEFNQTMAMR